MYQPNMMRVLISAFIAASIIRPVLANNKFDNSANHDYKVYSYSDQGCRGLELEWNGARRKQCIGLNPQAKSVWIDAHGLKSSRYNFYDTKCSNAPGDGPVMSAIGPGCYDTIGLVLNYMQQEWDREPLIW